MNVPFHRPPPQMGDAVDKARDAWLNGHGSAGPEVEEFESALGDYKRIDAARVVATDSCTSALALAVRVCGMKDVDVPSLTWNATANAALQAGASVNIAGVDEYGLLCPQEERSKGRDGAIYVELYGQCGDTHQVKEPDDKTLIIDAAQALEHDIFDRFLSCGARAACYSFHTLKSLPLGGGGAAIFRHRADADHARALRYHGVPTGPGGARTQVYRHGTKATMPAPFAAMGCELIQYVEEWREERKAIAKRYSSELRDVLDNQTPAEIMGRRGLDDCWHAYIVLTTHPDELVKYLGEKGVGTARYYVPLTSQPAWRSSVRSPKAERIGERAVALPLFGWMNAKEVDHVIRTVKSWSGW